MVINSQDQGVTDIGRILDRDIHLGAAVHTPHGQADWLTVAIENLAFYAVPHAVFHDTAVSYCDRWRGSRNEGARRHRSHRGKGRKASGGRQ